MARPPRIHVPGAFYHVILRANANQALFQDDEDWRNFKNLLADGIDRFDHQIHCFCGLSNHAHLAVRGGEQTLSRIFHNSNSRYGLDFNRRHGRHGHVFHGRFRSILVDSDEYLHELIRYIHLNPVRAGIAEAPEDYKWSSHRAYLGLENIPWLTTDWVLSLFGQDLTSARENLARFVSRPIDNSSDFADFERGSDVDKRILGNGDFIKRVLGEREPGSIVEKADPKTIIAGVCAAYGMSVEELRAPGKHWNRSEARAVAAAIVQDLPNASLSELSRYLARKASTLSLCAKKFKERTVRDANARRRLQSVRLKVLKNSKDQCLTPL
jgi:REP element-mobilizing transposase RayT